MPWGSTPAEILRLPRRAESERLGNRNSNNRKFVADYSVDQALRRPRRSYTSAAVRSTTTVVNTAAAVVMTAAVSERCNGAELSPSTRRRRRPMIATTFEIDGAVGLTQALAGDVVNAITGGGPAKATETLVYKVYSDGRIGGDLGGSAAQSVVLMIIVVVLTAVQLRVVDRPRSG